MGICSVIACLANSFCEGVIPWVIFFCVRSYAGGIHLKKYKYCLICSCIVYSVLLALNRFKTLNSNVSLCLSCFCVLIIVICANMKIGSTDEKEQKYFRSKLIKRLVLIVVIAVIFFVCRFIVALSMISYSLSAIAISSILQYFIYLSKNTV